MKNFIIILFLFLVSYSNASDSLLLKIHFQFDKYELTTTAKTAIDSFIASFDTSNKTIDSIVVYGHTDQLGTVNYNYDLAFKRANEAATYLRFRNANLSVKETKSFGKSQLITTDTSDEKRAQNRRVEIITFFQYKPIPIELKHPAKADTIKKVEEVKKYIPPKKISEILADTNIKIGDTVVLPYILFIGGLAEFLPVSYPHLDELFFAMRDNPNLEIEIQGHVCCSKGEEDGEDFKTGRYNLSVARARAVYDFLTISGINKRRLSYVGFGHKYPITQEKTEEEKTRNRRVEIKIIRK